MGQDNWGPGLRATLIRTRRKVLAGVQPGPDIGAVGLESDDTMWARPMVAYSLTGTPVGISYAAVRTVGTGMPADTSPRGPKDLGQYVRTSVQGNHVG